MMRVIFLLLVSSIALQSKSQTWNNYLQKRFKSYGLWADSISIQPSDTTVNKVARSIAIKGTTLYIADGTKWTGVSGGSSLPTQTGNAGKYLKTDGTNANWKAPNFSDSVDFSGAGSGNLLRIKPGSSPYLYEFAPLTSGIISLSVLAPLLTTGSSTPTLLIDTTTAVTGVATKGYVNSLISSGGSLSGGNLGSGFRLYKPSSSGIYTLFNKAGTGTTIDSTTNANGVTIGIDTTLASTKLYVNFKDDIQQVLINTNTSNIATNTTNINLRKLNTDSVTASGYRTNGRAITDSAVLRALTNTNITNIATNTTNIATNTTNIATKLTASDSVFYALRTPNTNVQTSSYTLVLSDAAKIVEINNASANTLTIPPNSSVAFPIGTVITGVQRGAGVTTITAGAGVTITSFNDWRRSGGQYAYYGLRKTGTNTWDAFGNIMP